MVLLFTLTASAHAGEPPGQERAPVRSTAGFESGADVVIDGEGYAYVVGTRRSGGDCDWFVQKHNRECTGILWETTYDGGLDDKAVALAVFGGRVYVAGTSSNGSNDDYLTIAYDCDNGAVIWVAHYNGPADGDDAPCDIVCNDGNVYVAGSVWNGALYGFDTATVRYESATGARLDRAVSGRLGNDFASDMELGVDGRVAVTGTGLGASFYDFLTFMYDPGLEDLWGGPATYDGPGVILSEDVAYAVVMDPEGDVYVTGRSEGFGGRSDFATLRYDGVTGEPVWPSPARYDSPGDANDIPVAICLGPGGSVFVSGHEEPVSGGGEWSTAHTIRYRPEDGHQIWETEREHSRARDMAIGSDGIVAVTGQTWDWGVGSWDYLTVRHSNDTGEVIWEATYAGQAGLYDVANAMAAFGSDLVVTGESGIDGGSSAVTIRYRANQEECAYVGRCLEDAYYEYHLSVPPSQISEWTAGVFDGAGAADGSAARFLIDMKGEETIDAGGAAHTRYYGLGLIATYAPGTCEELGIVRLPEYPLAGMPASRYRGLARDESDGSSWVSRPVWPVSSPPIPPSTVLVHVDVDGTEVESFTVEGHGIVGLALDQDNGHLWCVAKGDPDLLLEYDLSYSPPERIQGPLEVPWTRGSVEAAAGLDYIELTNELVAVDAASGMKEILQDVDPGYSGTPPWGLAGVRTVSACALTATPGAWGIAVLPEEDVALVAGTAVERPRPIDVYQHPVGLTTSVSARSTVALRAPRVHPNPFNPCTRIDFELPVQCRATLTIHNLKGQVVETLVDRVVSAGTHTAQLDASHLASGVYFCRLSTDRAVSGAKMVLLK
jgi:hypothetical protein